MCCDKETTVAGSGLLMVLLVLGLVVAVVRSVVAWVEAQLAAAQVATVATVSFMAEVGTALLMTVASSLVLYGLIRLAMVALGSRSVTLVEAPPAVAAGKVVGLVPAGDSVKLALIDVVEVGR